MLGKYLKRQTSIDDFWIIVDDVGVQEKEILIGYFVFL